MSTEQIIIRLMVSLIVIMPLLAFISVKSIQLFLLKRIYNKEKPDFTFYSVNNLFDKIASGDYVYGRIKVIVTSKQTKIFTLKDVFIEDDCMKIILNDKEWIQLYKGQKFTIPGDNCIPSWNGGSSARVELM